jgi:hypothetical protein
LQKHALACGSFVLYVPGNPNQDQITQLRAEVEELRALLVQRDASQLVSGTSQSAILVGGMRADEAQHRILANTQTSCEAKLHELVDLVTQYSTQYGMEDFVFLDDTAAFYNAHVRDTAGFRANADCAACGASRMKLVSD